MTHNQGLFTYTNYFNVCLFTSYLCDQTTVYMERVCEWLLLNANLAIVQLYHGANKLIFNEVAFVFDQHA